MSELKRSSREAWSRVEELFHAALARLGDERADLLAAECGDDETLRSEVESLLAAHEESEASGSFSESAAAALAAEMVSDPDAPPGSESPATGSATGPAARPEQIGPYRLVEVLGEGGMGTVYLAEQSEPLPRLVALKLMRWGGAHDETVRRFELEREALARMSHPAIAQVLDAGATEHGQPYFVLEYIPGESITDYCDQRRIGVRKRLELLCRVCDGVRHAHEKGVIHRDLKPSNILVREEKGVASPKIIDFGIAKALEPWSEKAASATATRWRMGSPAYMSPEAIEAGQGAVDTRSDVYSLGIVLYELLVGVRPVDLSPLSDHGLRDALGGDRPPPSQRLRGLPAEERRRTAGERGLDERKLVRRLRGELDWIALRAIEREPSRRYASPAELGADIERYLAHEAVAARPPSFAYRARKMVRRHAAAFTAATLVALALVAGIVSTALQSKRARSEAAAARQISDYLVELFEVSDPYQAAESVTARELLDRGRERIERELGDQPEIRARLLRTIGTVYHHLALHDEAEPLLLEALELAREVHGDRHLEVAESLEQLAKLMQDRGRWELAEEQIREALEIRERRLGDSAPEVAATLDELSYTVRRRGKFDEAEPLVRRALRIYEEGSGRNSAELATATENLASLLSETGDWDGAEPLFREALAMKRRLYPEGNLQVVTSLNHLSDVLRRKQGYEEAEALMRESLAMSRQLFGEDHPMVAVALDRLASVFFQQGEQDEAEPLMREALDLRQRFLGEDHPEVSESLNNLAVVLRHQGELEEAEGLLRRSIAIDREHLGSNHHFVGETLVNLAMLVMDRRGPANAEPIYREALDVYRVAYPEGFWVTALAQCRLGRCLVELEEYVEAEALLEEGLELLRRDRGESSPQAEVCAQGLVELYEASGKPELTAAGDLFERGELEP